MAFVGMLYYWLWGMPTCGWTVTRNLNKHIIVIFFSNWPHPLNIAINAIVSIHAYLDWIQLFSSSGASHYNVHIFFMWTVCKMTYSIAKKFGGELNLVVWLSTFAIAKLKSANISCLHICVWQSPTELKSTNIFAMAIWDPTAKFNSH